MTRLIALGLCVALTTGTAAAQPVRSPPPAPKTSPAPSPPPATPVVTPPAADKDAPAPGPADPSNKEHAGTNETLSKGGDVRPWAAGVSPHEQQTALQVFHDGNVMLNDGLFAKAADKYREALKHWQHPAIHYNMALALMNLDRPVEVYDSLEQATKFGPEPLENDKFERAKAYLLIIKNQIATIEVSCDKVGAKVSVDGREVFTVVAGQPNKYVERVRIGKHTFVAEKEGYATRINAPYIGPDEKFRIELKLFTADELTRYHRNWDRVWAPWVVVGAGAVVGIGAGVMQTSSKSSYDSFDSRIAKCGSAGCPVTADLKDLRTSGDTKKELAEIGYGVAAATAVVGLTLVYLNRKRPYQIRAEDLQTEQPMAIAPIVTPTMAGAMATVRF